jgi:hypothetical protein
MADKKPGASRARLKLLLKELERSRRQTPFTGPMSCIGDKVRNTAGRLRQNTREEKSGWRKLDQFNLLSVACRIKYSHGPIGATPQDLWICYPRIDEALAERLYDGI